MLCWLILCGSYAGPPRPQQRAEADSFPHRVPGLPGDGQACHIATEDSAVMEVDCWIQEKVSRIVNPAWNLGSAQCRVQCDCSAIIAGGGLRVWLKPRVAVHKSDRGTQCPGRWSGPRAPVYLPPSTETLP